MALTVGPYMMAPVVLAFYLPISTLDGMLQRWLIPAAYSEALAGSASRSDANLALYMMVMAILMTAVLLVMIPASLWWCELLITALVSIPVTSSVTRDGAVETMAILPILI